ncbi:MAG: LemA family protein [Ruminococcaceae bacterium]|nr:LemA family protein [Oscillospiraceae bacterium]
MKKKGLIILIAVIAIIALLAGSVISSYNDLVEDREEVETSWSQISVQLQRRADLIPNLVNTVKGYTEYEQSTLTAVTEARNALKNAGSINDQITASNRLDSALNVWVNAVTEAYPELKANTQFTALTDELSGTENRIAVARRDYNEDAREFNAEIKKFPTSILAGIFGFDAYDYFEAQAGTENAPIVNFN